MDRISLRHNVFTLKLSIVGLRLREWRLRPLHLGAMREV